MRRAGTALLTILLAYAGNLQERASAAAQAAAPQPTVMYLNRDFGFRLRLPGDWAGYSVVKSGPNPYVTLLIRHPLWTAAAPREDIPILVFTRRQWTQVQQEKLIVSAAPVPPSELGRNHSYVFALPPRFDFDELEGVQEVDRIVQGHPLQAF